MNNIIRIASATGISLITWLYGGFFILKFIFQPNDPTSVRAITGFLGLIILFVGVRQGIKKAQVAAGSNGLTYFDCLKTGFFISISIAVMISLFGLLYMTVINPDFNS